MGHEIFNEDKYYKGAIAESIQAKRMLMIQNEIDDYKLIGLHIDQAINELRNLFPDSNNYFSYPSNRRHYDNSCLFQFGTPLQLLHIFCTGYVIDRVIKVF